MTKQPRNKSILLFNKIAGSTLMLALCGFFLTPAEGYGTLKREPMKITSTAFIHQGQIPEEYTCDASDISPALAWSDVPEGTKSFALIMDDPDAPSGRLVHWAIYNIPGDKTALPASIPAKENFPDGTQQRKNSFRKPGYSGPCPPAGNGAHRYFFKLHALDAILDIQQGVHWELVESAMKDHILERAEIIGRYERPPAKKISRYQR